MPKLFLKNIKCGTQVKIKSGAAVINHEDIAYFWPEKYKDYIFFVNNNKDFREYVVQHDETILKTNMHNLTIL